MNPLFQSIGKMTMPQMGGFGQMIQQFQQFKATFQGDPKAEVMKMLQSGKITQQQLNQAQAMATQFKNLLK